MKTQIYSALSTTTSEINRRAGGGLRRTATWLAMTYLVTFQSHGLAQNDAAPLRGGPTEIPDAPNYTAPESHRLDFNFNQDWKFIKQNAAGAEHAVFDDSSWSDVSLPHTFNDVDSFRNWRSHNARNGPDDDREKFFEGKVWYRKHFTLDAAWSGRKVFLEFEGVRNTGKFYVNGKLVGEHSNQVGPCGLDVTDFVRFGADNVIAVQVDSNMLAKDPAGFSYGWSAQAFYPPFGGLVKDAVLHITDRLYQTLPLYSNLKTSGIYVHEQDIDTGKKTAQLTVDAEVANDYTTPQTAVFEAWVVDRDGKVVWKKNTAAQAVAVGVKIKLSVNGPLADIHFWSPDYPYLYRVFSSLTVGGKVVDVCQTPLGVRLLTFSAKEGLKINGHPIYLKGYAPRTTMEWAVTGIPQDWMTEYDYKLMKENNANFIRPMHVAPRKHQIESADKFGIIMTCPAGNGEGDDPNTPEGNARWADRVALMRDVTIYYRNNPSVVFYEASNSGITKKHMQDMVDVKNEWDPYGDRFSGTRGTDEKTEDIKGYESQMDGIFRTTAIPAWDAEYARAESPRRIWDNYTPFLAPNGSFVTGGYIKVASRVHVESTATGGGDGIYEYPQDAFRLNNSEDLALNNILKYYDRYKLSAFVEPVDERLTKGVTVGGAKIIFADSNSHGRMLDMEVARVSGVLDAVRLPKESYYAMQVAHNDQAEVQILGHWNYPAGTVKSVWVICNADKVRLATYDEQGKLVKDYGWGVRDLANAQKDRENHYAFKFPAVAWQPGKIEATAYSGNNEVARQDKVTVGSPASLKLTPVIGPDVFRADGADIAMFDVEVVDANGLRCPTDEGGVDFVATGAGSFLGGYNSGIRFSTLKNYLNTEAGINRVFVRATRTPGEFTLTATRPGLKPATATITSAPFQVSGGLTTVWPRRYGYVLGAEPAAMADNMPTRAVAVKPAAAPATGVMREFAYTGTQGDTLNPPMPVAHIEHNGRNGSRIYVDEPWTFAGLPDYLAGGDYVQAFQRDASESSSTDTIQFYTNQRCNLYQLVDAANGMPKHENTSDYQWMKLPETVTINGRTLDIYRSRTLPEGYNGYFASNGFGIHNARNSGQYIVFAVAAP
jgi:beta-galactosidase